MPWPTSLRNSPWPSLLIAIDELQWADPSSLRTLAAIARRPRTFRWRWSPACAPYPELHRLLDLLLDTPHTRHLSVGGLDPAGSRLWSRS